MSNNNKTSLSHWVRKLLLVSLLVILAFAITSPSAYAARSQHGLDDSDTVGVNGYDIHNRGEAFLKDSYPKEDVWRKIWNFCSDSGCNGSFSIDKEWAVCRPRIPGENPDQGECTPRHHSVTVKVEGQYDRVGWDVRDAFMQDLSAHHYGDGGVYSSGDIGWPLRFGYPPGWWIASDTWIRKNGTGFWVNIKIQ